ncbi:MAG: TIR domain-containing protein, partial [Candidatus Competibacteraceae bacterium]|nr:TIR domain-containing protein [Candidatus Competibacteraceae bacterium]
MRNKIFISYSRQDQDWLDRFRTMSKPLINSQYLEVWSDKNIDAGQQWREQIKTALASAKVAVFLVSPDSLASRFIMEDELTPMLEAEARGENIAITWFQLRHCLYKETPLEPYQRLYPKPLNGLSDAEIDQALAEICQSIQKLAKTSSPKTTPSNPSKSSLAEHYRAYHERCIQQWRHPRYQLDQRFVHLTLLIDQTEDTQGIRWLPHQQTFSALSEILDEVPDQPLVLLGQPGAGKSTLLRHFELDTAQHALASAAPENAPLSFFVPLSAYKADAKGQWPSPLEWLSTRWAKLNPALPPLENLLKQQRLILLLDALNEVPLAHRESITRWRDFIQQLADDYPGNRVIFSCRSLDYSASLSSKDLPVPQVRIEPLDDEQVQAFLHSYCEEHADALWTNLRGTKQLDLLRLPFFLKLLTDQAHSGAIPEGRAALFGGFVRRALRREIDQHQPLFQAGKLLSERDIERLSHTTDWKPGHALPSGGMLCNKLSALAFAMQDRYGPKATSAEDAENPQVRLDYDEALALLSGNQAIEQAKQILKAGEALNLLDEDPSDNTVGYTHQLLQEFFAARQLATKPEPARVQRSWRISEVTPSLSDTLATLAASDTLSPLPSSGWEETTVLAAAMSADQDQFVRELMGHHLVLAGRCAVQPDVNLSGALLEDLRQALLARSGNPEADLRERIDAGLALGLLGDPCFEQRSGPQGDYLMPPLVTIPGGTYRIGSEDGDDDEKPIIKVRLEVFALGQFPVTNA